MKAEYNHDFYKDRHLRTVYSATTILAIVSDILPELKSAIDFGCGVGTWLSVLNDRGVLDIQGLDGPWVDKALLEIPLEAFRNVDFENVIVCERKYDLAITLEVAEHLSERAADSFIESLVTASDFVLFSAAIPFQGGQGHVNEQWPDYWASKFANKGFVALDLLRGIIWNDKRIPVWYRQNILLFVKNEKASLVDYSNLAESQISHPLSMVHPDAYLAKMVQVPHVRESWKSFRQAVGRRLMRTAKKLPTLARFNCR